MGGTTRLGSDAKVANRQISSSKDDFSAQVKGLFDALAPALLKGGVTAHQISEFAKEAILRAAIANAQMSTGRTNHSRVAAVTGLTRAEIRKRLSQPGATKKLPARALDRSSRVISGWRRDPAFLNSRGRPRPLALDDQVKGFPALVRRHSGDVPPRAILETLKERSAISVKRGEVRLRPTSSVERAAAHSALADVTPYVGVVLGHAASSASRLVYASQLKLLVDSDKRELFVTERVVEVLSAAIAVLQALPDANHTAHKLPPTRALQLAVTLVSGISEQAAPKNEKGRKRS